MRIYAAKLTGLFLVVAAIFSTGSAAAEREPAPPATAAPPAQEQAVEPTPTASTQPQPSPSPTPTATAARTPFGASFGSMVARSLVRKQQERKRDEFKEVPAELANLLRDSEAQIGIVVQPLSGAPLFTLNPQQAFPLASVTKIYMLVAYLDRLEHEGRAPDEEEIDLLEAMIEVSDNDSAEEIWASLGGFEAMQAYLASAGLRPLEPPVTQQLLGGAELEPDAWGDAAQTPTGMADFLIRLRTQRLLNAENTLLASRLLGRVVEEQSWGVNAGVEELDQYAQVQFKNGWYPAEEGWRINSAGIVLPSNGHEPYVLIIFGQGLDDWAEGIELVEAIASLINEVMLKG